MFSLGEISFNHNRLDGSFHTSSIAINGKPKNFGWESKIRHEMVISCYFDGSKCLEATLLSRIAVAMDGQVVKCPLLTLLILMWIERITNHYKLALTQTWALNLHRFLSLSRKPRSAWNLCPTFPCRQGKLRSCNQPGMYKMSNLSPVCRGSKPETGLFEITWSWKDTMTSFGSLVWAREKLCFFHGVSPVFHVPEKIPSWS